MQITNGQQNEIVAGVGLLAKTRTVFVGGVGTAGKVGSPYTIFTVTGTVALKILATCEVNLAGASATVAVGTALSTAGLIAQSTATDIDASEIWHDATPDASIEATTVLVEKIVSQDIIITTGTAPVTEGQILFTVLWRPLTDGATVTATNAWVEAADAIHPSASLSPSGSVSPSSSTSLSPSSSTSPSASASRSKSASVSPSGSVSPSSSTSPSPEFRL